MKLLAFVDMHNSLDAFKKIKQKAKKESPDLIICAGDLTIFEHKLFDILKKLNKLNIEVLVIPGNHEDTKSIEHYAKNLKNIRNMHKKTFEKEDITFLGYGGGGFSQKDKDFEKWSKKYIKLKDKKTVLITHGPSYKSGIDKIHHEDVGNKSYTKFIDKIKPILVISGHLHENAKKHFKIKGILYQNPGPFGEIIKI